MYQLTVGDQFPPIKLKGIDSNNEFVDVTVDEGYQPLKHDWTVVYFYPKDFTFICPTEIKAMDVLVDEEILSLFDRRVDSVRGDADRQSPLEP